MRVPAGRVTAASGAAAGPDSIRETVVPTTMAVSRMINPSMPKTSIFTSRTDPCPAAPAIRPVPPDPDPEHEDATALDATPQADSDPGDPDAGGDLEEVAAAPVSHRITITGEAAGQRLDRTLVAALPSQSRARLQALIGDGRVAVDGSPVLEPARKLRAGAVVTIEIPPPSPARPQPQPIPLTIVYEDAALIVIDKPAGMVVHPASGNTDGTLVNALLAHCGDSLSGIGGVARPGIVHRLDKDTSGLMVVAKTDAAHRALAAQFADRSLSRRYVAAVIGRPHPRAGTVEGAIGRDPRDRKRMAVVASGGKPALTRYETLASREAAALLRCTLATGRTHQIRVHMAAIGHPLIGDRLYGDTRAARRMLRELPALAQAFPRQALHAAELRFRHPGDGDERVFTSPLPTDMRALLMEIFDEIPIPDPGSRV